LEGDRKEGMKARWGKKIPQLQMWRIFSRGAKTEGTTITPEEGEGGRGRKTERRERTLEKKTTSKEEK